MVWELFEREKNENCEIMPELSVTKKSLLLSFFIVLIACNKVVEQSIEEETNFSLNISDEKLDVQGMIVTDHSFRKEIFSNGKICAFEKAELEFKNPGIVKKLLVSNGTRVRKNQLIAEQENDHLKNLLEQAKVRIEASMIELQDILLGQGFDLADSIKIPSTLFNSAKIKSGFSQAQLEYKMSRLNYESSILRSPINGVVANLTAKRFQNSSSGETNVYCLVVDNSRLEINFPLMEVEFKEVKLGLGVDIVPLAYPETIYTGKVNKVNPIVDENGFIHVNATIEKNARGLVEGMNANVILFVEIPQQIIVPKEAIRNEGSRKVVFTYKDNRAQWNYVQTGLENSSDIVVVEGISVGDTIIISNTIFLAHDLPVNLTEVIAH